MKVIEVVKKRKKLEEEVNLLMSEFERETKTIIFNVNLERTKVRSAGYEEEDVFCGINFEVRI